MLSLTYKRLSEPCYIQISKHIFEGKVQTSKDALSSEEVDEEAHICE